jgi:polysaccharide export outer membrane protein
MRLSLFTYLILGLLFILTSCSYKQDNVLFQQKRSTPDSALQKNFSNPGNYRIKPQDILQIKNVQNSKNIIDLTPSANTAISSSSIAQQDEDYRVEDDGTVALTGLGRVHVEGLTRIKATKYIEELYHKSFLKDPILELKIVNLKVTMLGEIKAQGSYPLTKDRTTLIEMIGLAGGLTDRANERNVEIIRGDQKNPEVIEMDLSDLKSLSDPKAILQNNDIVYIKQNKRAVRTNKLQNFSTIMQPALLLINTALIIFTLVRN